LSTGGEIGQWIWRTYLRNGDRAFLVANYPVMAEVTRFLLAYQTPGEDGLLHTAPSNAHETQADVRDPATDIAAIRSLYPATIAAAHELGRDADLAERLNRALARTPALPLMHANTHALQPAGTATGLAEDVVFAASYDAGAEYQNAENIGLEAVWPYALITADDPLFPIARRTFVLRPFVHVGTWSDDPIHAVRLGLGDEFAKAIFQIAQLYQAYPNGMAEFPGGGPREFYIETSAVAALALSEALAIEEDSGRVRIAPALPHGWTMSGHASLRGGASVDVDAVDGALIAFTLRGGNAKPMRLATPWSGQAVRVIDNGKALRTIAGGSFEFTPLREHVYRFERDGAAPAASFAVESAATFKSLGRASIGLTSPCCAPPVDYDPHSDLSKF
jgi:hypothetical protein